MLNLYLDSHPWLAFYLVGCAVSFAISVLYLFSNILRGFSTFGRNLRKIGVRISWTYGTLKDVSGDDMEKDFKGFLSKFLLSILVCALNSLTSWLIFVTLVYSVISRFIKSLGVPREVKDSRWRLKNIQLDFDGVLRNIKAIEGKLEYSADRAELLKSLRDREIIGEYEFNRLAALGIGAASS